MFCNSSEMIHYYEEQNRRTIPLGYSKLMNRIKIHIRKVWISLWHRSPLTSLISKFVQTLWLRVIHVHIFKKKNAHENILFITDTLNLQTKLPSGSGLTYILTITGTDSCQHTASATVTVASYNAVRTIVSSLYIKCPIILYHTQVDIHLKSYKKN